MFFNVRMASFFFGRLKLAATIISIIVRIAFLVYKADKNGDLRLSQSVQFAWGLTQLRPRTRVRKSKNFRIKPEIGEFVTNIRFKFFNCKHGFLIVRLVFILTRQFPTWFKIVLQHLRYLRDCKNIAASNVVMVTRFFWLCHHTHRVSSYSNFTSPNNNK